MTKSVNTLIHALKN